jgi:hypothetical protein
MAEEVLSQACLAKEEERGLKRDLLKRIEREKDDAHRDKEAKEEQARRDRYWTKHGLQVGRQRRLWLHREATSDLQ